MISYATSQKLQRQRTGKIAGLLLVLLFLSVGLVPEAEAACPNPAFAPQAQLIQLVSCTEGRLTSNEQVVNIPVPAATQNGDLLVTALAVDNNETLNVPAGWTALTTNKSTEGLTTRVFYRRVTTVAEPGSYNFTWGSNERAYGYMLRLTNTSGLFVSNDNEGNSSSPLALSLNTLSLNNLILRVMGVDRRPINIDPATISSGHINITQDRSDDDNGAVSGAGAYRYQATIGSTGSASFSLTSNDGWHARTIAFEPIEFRFSHSGTASVCGSELVTLSVTDRLGNPITWFRGAITLTAGGAGNWSNPGGLTGTFNNGTLNDGIATYTFAAGDNGVATFQYQNPNTGSINFGVNYGGLTNVENPSFDSNLVIDNLCRFRISYVDSTMGTCSSELVTVTVVDSGGANALFYSGTITISNAPDNEGDYSLDTGGGAFNNGTANDGSATYSFVNGESSVVLDYTTTSSGTINFDISDAGNPTFAVDGGPGYDPNLTVIACEFRIIATGDTLTDTCSQQELTIEVRDDTGGLALDYAGLVTISNDALGVGAGTYTLTSGTNAFNDLGGGVVEYQFDAADDGDIVFTYNLGSVDNTVNFNVVENVPTGISSPVNPYDPTLDVAACTIDIQVAPVTGVCSAGTTVSISILDRDSNPATAFNGEIQINTDSTFGNYALTPGGLGGNGSFDNLTINDGIATYQFDPLSGDAGEVQLDFSSLQVETLQFTASSTGSVALSIDVGSNRDLDVTTCEVRIDIVDPSDESDVCSIAEIVITITNSTGTTIPNFVGDITLSTSSSTGNWSGGGINAVNNGAVGDGDATYTFDYADNSSVTFDFRNSFVNAAINFDVSGTATNGSPVAVSTAPGADPDLDVQACTVDIQVTDGIAQNCSAGEIVTYTIRNRNSNIATDYAGTLVMTTDTSHGNYTPVGANGTFDNGTLSDGIATYIYDTLDNGVLTVMFSDKFTEIVNLNASSTSITLDPGSDRDINFGPCEFRIAYTDATPGTTDICSVESVQIGVYDGTGTLVTDYTGTVNLTTTTGHGTWIDPGGSALGTLIDPVSKDGSATYSFVAGDLGEITLNFVDLTSETVNINISDGVTTDPADNTDPNDPDLLVALCKIQVSFDGGGASLHEDATMSACSVQQVTFEVYDRFGAIDTDYVGKINLSTSTLNGNWSGGSGGLVDTPGDDNGAATYQFSLGDAGVVTLNFTDPNAETVNFNAVDGVLTVDGTADPNLEVQSCLPTISDQSCVLGNSASVTIDAQNALPSLRGRMVVMAMAWEGDADVSSARFDVGGANTPMTKIIEERIDSTEFDNNTELWGILDANLPVAGGTYTADFTHTDDAPAMCLFYFNEVAQVFPTENLTTPANGTANATQAFSTQVTSTSIRTTQNNALVLSLVSNGDSGNYDLVSPDPPMTRLFNGPDPGSAVFAGSSGIAPTATPITIEETASSNPPNRHTHIVAAFNPLITGPPVATGYEPVTLFQTYSGSLSYRAIGNTFRNAANPSSCSFNATASASLTLPDEGGPPFDSTVQAAWLYWFASGDDDLGQTDTAVTITDPSTTATDIDADGVFLIDNQGGGGNLDYFAAYKDITALVSGNGTYTLSNLTIQNGAPWNGTEACAGGWAMIVIYDNPYEQLRVVNLFHGFQPFQWSNFTLVPRNFRMSSPLDIEDLPNGQITHVTVEGDETLANGDESLQIQDSPGSLSFSPLTTYYNPLQSEFNGTVTRPLYSLVDVDPGPGVTQYYLFDSSQGAGGYEIDFPGADVGDEIPGAPDPGAGDQIGSSFGVDIDTHYISGDGNTADGDDDVLNAFALAQAEEITTRYSAGQDLVLLVAEVIAITNAPMADIEVFVSEAGTFKVNGTGSYQFEVKNNGNDSSSFGSATGEITISDTLPAGMTFASVGDVTGDGWVCSVTLDPGAFTCTFDIANDWTLARGANVAGNLGETFVGSGVGESLPILTATVQIGDSTFFPALNNNSKNVARVLHSGGNCDAAPDGVSPDPATCDISPEFDQVNNLQGGTIDINNLDDKTATNNNLHSTITNVKGVETDLGVNKFVNGVLEEGSAPGAGQYTIRVTNYGPDTTTENFTITDVDPPYITFVSVVPDVDWNCSAITPTLTCEYIGPGLPISTAKDLVLNVTVDGVADNIVTNTTQVEPGEFNFDPNPANDQDTDITTIVPAPVASNEKFLISVSTALGLGGPTDLDGLSAFDDQDLVLYDPLLDQATLFFDHSDTPGASIGDINAVHLLPNGQIILSANSDGNTLGGVSFNNEDLVLYDPINNTASLYFDGSAIFADPGENIDAVYVMDNGNVVISTVDSANIGPTAFDKSDMVLYNIMAGTASILVDGSASDVFGSPDLTQVDAFYIRVDPTDATATIDTYAYSTDDSSANIGAGGTPPGGTNFTRDDVVELDRTADESQNLFLGNVPLGVFLDNGTANPDPQLRLDALHIVEDGYMGHFRISQSQAGNTCEVGKFTITKHQGLTHNIDTDYVGSIRLSTNTGTGTWGIALGSGPLSDATIDDGAAVYTFVPSDNGQVTLSLNITTVTPGLNINVTNGIVRELGSEDPNFNFNSLVTVVTYRDEFQTASFSNNDGTTGWANSWFEIDDFNGINGGNSGAGVGVGNIQIISNKLRLKSNPSTAATGRQPSLARRADLSLFNTTETVYLNYDYNYSSLNASDRIIVEVSDDNGSNWQTIRTHTGLVGTNASPVSENLNVTTLGGVIDDFTANLDVRFRVDNGYTLASQFFVDNVELATGTTDCGIGVIDHYHIDHDTNAISCLASVITITGHDANHFVAAPALGEVMTLQTSTGKGTWASILTGGGILSDIGVQGAPGNTNGQGTYTWTGTEESIQLLFNYTDPTTDPEAVNFELSGSNFEDDITPGHDDNLIVRQAGLLFYNETDLVAGIPTQIAGKPSNQYALDKIITLQAVRTSDADPLVCEPLFPDTQLVNIQFSAECDDPDDCSITAPAQQFTVNGTPITLSDQNGVAPPSVYQTVPVTFANQTTGTGAELVLNYSDVGKMEIHARYDIPFNSDPDFPITSEDFLVGNSTFVVRPFGFDIDFDQDRFDFYDSGDPLVSRADDANGPAFNQAGTGFTTTVTARAWQAADDPDEDGVPNIDANLTDNAVTPNYGNELTAAENDIVITHTLVEPAVAIGSRDGTLTGGNSFIAFTAGTSTQDLNFDEVGIISLTATLADSNYLNGGQNVSGNVVNVGRFYPANFNLTGAAAAAVCTVDNDFTYMGQPFTVSFTLEARNANNVITQNYIGDFVKLSNTDFDSDAVFHAVEDLVGMADVEHSGRLTSVDSSFTTVFDDFGDAAPGTGSIMGTLIFARENDGMGVDGAEDGPYLVRLGTSVTDSDAVAITLTPGTDIDVDDGITEPGTSLYRKISGSDIEFRYGRLIIENSFGPETEPLEIAVRVQYWDGTDFVQNEDDSCLTLNYVAADPALAFVPGSYTGLPDTLVDGDTVIEQGSSDFNITLANGQTADINIEANPSDPDRPFITSAPIGEHVGSVLVELDLTNGSLTNALNFLTYDWRGGAGEEDIYDEVPEGDNYTDNPRGAVQFGSYRGHDRVINWQEIYIGPGP